MGDRGNEWERDREERREGLRKHQAANKHDNGMRECLTDYCQACQSWCWEFPRWHSCCPACCQTRPACPTSGRGRLHPTPGSCCRHIHPRHPRHYHTPCNSHPFVKQGQQNTLLPLCPNTDFSKAIHKRYMLQCNLQFTTKNMLNWSIDQSQGLETFVTLISIDLYLSNLKYEHFTFM